MFRTRGLDALTSMALLIIPEIALAIGGITEVRDSVDLPLEETEALREEEEEEEGKLFWIQTSQECVQLFV